MRNYWLKDKIVAKGHTFWTFEIFDSKKKTIVPETIVKIDECPSMKVLESLEVDENDKKVWKPVLIIWEKFEATYTDTKFLESHDHIRVIEANGDAAGILRHYNESGDHVESWVMHGLELTNISFETPPAIMQVEAMKVVFTFQYAQYLTDNYG